MNCDEFVVLKRFGGNERQILCGCGVTFFSDYCDDEIRCPSCFKEDKLFESIEALAKFAIENGRENDLARIILVMSEGLQEFDLSDEDDFSHLSKF